MGSINLKDAEEARDAITEAQKKEIANMYESFSKDLSYEANKFKATATNPSAALVNMQKKELSKMLRTTSKKVTEEVNGKIIQSMTNVSSAVASSNQKWLESLGFPQGGIQAVLSNVPDFVVRNIISGNIYEGGWNLSKAIWGDREVFLKDAYSIVAGGIAENKSIYEISKKLESYVSPSAKKQWNLKMADGRRIYPKKVDYNAQRLARTLSQHAYQQSILAINKKNPFILGYRWHATGSRACPICEARDGVIYSEDDLPMDHPNGMCIMEPVTDPNMDDRLAAWAKGADDPAIDAYAERFGYDISKKQSSVMSLEEKINELKSLPQAGRVRSTFKELNEDEYNDAIKGYALAMRYAEEKVIDLDKLTLYTVQPELIKTNLLEMSKLDLSRAEDKILIQKVGGKNIVMDGNHRTQLAILRGDKNIKVNYVDIDLIRKQRGK